MFGTKIAKRAKAEYIRRQLKKRKQRTAEHYKRKRLLCEKCGLCRLSVEKIEENYDEILQRITVEKNKKSEEKENGQMGTSFTQKKR